MINNEYNQGVSLIMQNITKSFSLYFVIIISLLPALSSAAKKNITRIIAKEPVTMMDLGLLRLNALLGSRTFPGLPLATIGANYNVRRGTIDIKVSNPVKRASKKHCKKTVQLAKKIFIQKVKKKKTSNIHHYFRHEGTAYKYKVNLADLSKHVVITGIVLTEKNFQHSVYCQSKLMKNKVTF